jgi:hypothetical protein
MIANVYFKQSVDYYSVPKQAVLKLATDALKAGGEIAIPEEYLLKFKPYRLRGHKYRGKPLETHAVMDITFWGYNDWALLHDKLQEQS